MKKRLFLSMVSFFMVTAMWASLLEAYQIYVTAANGKTNATAELTLNMKNKVAIATWQCTLVLPEGVTFQSVALLDARVPEGYNPNLQYTVNEDGTVFIMCEGEEGVALTGNDGAVATVTVAIAADAPVGDCVVNVKNARLEEPNGDAHNRADNEYTWTIEQGEEPGVEGDFNGDGAVDIADGVAVLAEMAVGSTDPKYDLNGDGIVDIADFVAILSLIAASGSN